VETHFNVGKLMIETTAKIDEKGRITIPKKIRKAAKIKPGTYVNIKTKDTTIIIEPAESIAKKYAGICKVAKWPEDLDEFTVEAQTTLLRRKRVRSTGAIAIDRAFGAARNRTKPFTEEERGEDRN